MEYLVKVNKWEKTFCGLGRQVKFARCQFYAIQSIDGR